METTKEKFKKIREKVGDKYCDIGTNELEWSQREVVEIQKATYKFAKKETDQRSTSQKETIERLRGGLKELVSIVKIHSKATKNNFAWAELEEAEQLLSTTEPELDEQQIEDKRIEELTERNVKIVGDFMEHCESEGFVIPDHLYESYFNA